MTPFMANSCQGPPLAACKTHAGWNFRRSPLPHGIIALCVYCDAWSRLPQESGKTPLLSAPPMCGQNHKRSAPVPGRKPHGRVSTREHHVSAGPYRLFNHRSQRPEVARNGRFIYHHRRRGLPQESGNSANCTEFNRAASRQRRLRRLRDAAQIVRATKGFPPSADRSAGTITRAYCTRAAIKLRRSVKNTDPRGKCCSTKYYSGLSFPDDAGVPSFSRLSAIRS